MKMFLFPRLAVASSYVWSHASSAGRAGSVHHYRESRGERIYCTFRIGDLFGL